MRIHPPLSTLSICALAALTASCHGHHHRALDAGIDPASDCQREPFKSQDICKGGIQVRVNTCPKISLMATPTRVAPDGRVLLTASVFDAEGDAVMQDWLADPDGTLDPSMDPNVFYSCESIGRKTITVIATDALGCESMEELEVSCIDAASFENAGADPLP
jgi:hypothetical protein